MSERENLFRFMLNQKDNSILELYLFSAVTSRPEIDWDSWEIKNSTTSGKYFAKKLAEYPDVKEIHLHINSPGGEISEGTAIRNLLKSHTAKVIAYIDGWACSIASVIATAADEVVMYSNSLMFIHTAWCTVSGNAEELRSEAEALDKMTEAAIECYAEKAGAKADKEKIQQLVKNESWLTAKECFELGLCDKIEKSITDGVSQMLQESKKYEMSAEFNNNIQKLIELLKKQENKRLKKDPQNNVENAEKLIESFKSFLKIKGGKNYGNEKS